MREEYITPDMDITIFGSKNVLAESPNSGFVDDDSSEDGEYEEDGW